MLKSDLRRDRVTFVVTSKELEILKENAKEAGMLVSDYLRQIAIYKEIK